MHHDYKMKNKSLLFFAWGLVCFSDWEGQCISHPVKRYTSRVGHSLEDSLIYTLKCYVNTDLLKVCLAFTVKSSGLPDVLTEMWRLSSRYEIINITVCHTHAYHIYLHILSLNFSYFLSTNDVWSSVIFAASPHPRHVCSIGYMYCLFSAEAVCFHYMP